MFQSKTIRQALLLSCLFCAPLTSCSAPEDAHVRVEVSTSLAAGVDFVWIDTDIGAHREGLPSEQIQREQLRVRYEASRALEWSTGVLAAEFEGIRDGTYVVRVALRTSADDVVLVQELIAEIVGDTTLRLRLDRGCIAATCPSASGSVALSACRQAACVDPRCDPTDISTRDELCPALAFCESSDECESPVSPCAEAYCVDGTCIEAPTSIDVCPVGQYCDTRLGCRFLSDPLPACGTVCDLREDDCAIGYWNCDLPSPRCDPISSVPPGSMCRQGDESAGACDERGECVDCVEGVRCVSGCLIGAQMCAEAGMVCDTSEFQIAMVGADCVQPTGRPGFCDDTGGCTGCPVGGCDAEVCNGIDDDNDGSIDEEAADAVVYYNDMDGDSFGGTALAPACERPPRSSVAGGDCNDENREQYPGAPTFCNDVDDDCDGNFDEDLPTWYADVDGDGFGGAIEVVACSGPPGSVGVPGDCDDTMPSVFPGAAELCDGVDNNCAGGVDEGDPGGGERCGSSIGECDEGALRCAGGALVCVGALGPSAELCDGLDNDCNGNVDDDDPGGGAACDPSGDCAIGAEVCVDGALVCQLGPECDCVPNLPCTPANVCEAMGVTVCIGGVSSCSGIPRNGSCGVEDAGDWSACSGFGDTCDETGTQTRALVRPICVEGGCDSAPRTETRACRRDQNFVVCGVSTTVDGAACAFMTSCIESGVSTRIRTDYGCRDESCEGADTTLFDPCTRDTGGVSCGSVTTGEWGDCAYPTLCANDGVESRNVVTPVCATGLCDMPSTTESRACMRNSSGLSCDGPRLGPWSECKPLPGICPTSGNRDRIVTETHCAAEMCSNVVSSQQSEPCSFDSEGLACGDASPGRWGPCEYEDQCAEEGLRSRTIQARECSTGTCAAVVRTETERCERRTEEDRCAQSQTEGWSDCLLTSCSSVDGFEYHFDDGVCSTGRCVPDLRGTSDYTISRACSVPDTEGVPCVGAGLCGFGHCERQACRGVEAPVCDELACCGDECREDSMCGLKTNAP